VAGLIYIITGIVFIITVPSETRKATLYLAYYWFPTQFWGSIFILAGIMAILSARWPRFSDSWGYVVLTGLSTGWSGIYIVGMIFSHMPTASFTAGVIWGLLAYLWWAISGLINPVEAVEINECG
jgi:hypothetical protein